MDVVLIIVSIVCAVLGVVGSVLPVLPGPPISYVALLLLSLCSGVDVSSTALFVNAVLVVVITLFDFFAPAWSANLTGGSKYAVNGATLGMLVGFFMGPIGIIIGPFVGALLGELKNSPSLGDALKVAFASLLSFFITTGIKLFYGLLLLFWIVAEVIALLFK